MIKTIETATENEHLVAIVQKYTVNPMLLSQPSMLFIRIASRLYKQHPDVNYAVVSRLPEKMELVEYENEQELMDYCRKMSFNTAMTVANDGSESGMVIPVPGVESLPLFQKKERDSTGNPEEDRLLKTLDELTDEYCCATDEIVDGLLKKDEAKNYYQNASTPRVFKEVMRTLGKYFHERGSEAWNELPAIRALSCEAVKTMVEKFPDETKEVMNYFLTGAVECLTAEESDIGEEEVNEFGPMIQKWKGYLSEKDVVKFANKGIEYAVDTVRLWLKGNDVKSARKDAERIKAKLAFVKGLSEQAHDKIIGQIRKQYQKEIDFLLGN